MLSYLYYNTVGLLERQTEETIQAEVSGLADQFRSNGEVGLISAIERRMANRDSDIMFMLADPQGKHITGNLRSPTINSMPDNSWIDFTVTSSDDNATVGHVIHAFNVQLPDNFQLLVGEDVQDLNQFRNLVRDALYWSIGLSLAMGLVGGVLLSRNFLQRVDAITASSRVIMNGDLSGRMPVSGSGDELDRLSQSLNEMLGQIEKLMSGMREVSSNVAHDLRTPLTRLRARIEAALRADDAGNHRGALQQTLADSDALLQTFNAVLSITQIESGQQRANLQVLDAHEILEDVVDLYTPVAEESGGTLKLESEPGLLVRGKRELMAQALTNLIDNAMKYGEGENGVADIIVTGRRSGNDVVIAVADHGGGIAEADRARALQRFVRLDESRSKPGNGLGLSLVSGVANLLNGNIILGSNTPGLKAELHLPYVNSAK
ncbi:sensor histidine kinase [Aestuariivirga litoralis]|uniref:sensor histidine kinase n=1 Tax=Aestuariivirga litoralis TaxID=2650924 RepID=UPI001FEFF787|nr:HAMP domain-containing sensor histidine kinase [Aestuariivirga litoralis]